MLGYFSLAKTVLKSLFSKPATLMYPFVKREFAPKTRGSIRIEIDKCIFCGICQRKCPTQAIVVTKDAKKWEINPFRCIICNACVEACPKKCLFTEGQYSASAATKSVRTEVQAAKPAQGETPNA